MGKGVLLDVIPPMPYEFIDDRKEKRVGISYKVQLKFGRALAEVNVTEDMYNKLKDVPLMTEVDVLLNLALGQDKKSFRPVFTDARVASVISDRKVA